MKWSCLWPSLTHSQTLFECTLQSLPLYLEFLQHHLLMGASHIFLTAPFAWGGAMMTNIQRILRSFIEDGSVSITSHADKGVDYLYSTRGMSFDRDNLKLFQVNDTRSHCMASHSCTNAYKDVPQTIAKFRGRPYSTPSKLLLLYFRWTSALTSQRAWQIMWPSGTSMSSLSPRGRTGTCSMLLKMPMHQIP